MNLVTIQKIEKTQNFRGARSLKALVRLKVFIISRAPLKNNRKTQKNNKKR